MNAERPNIHRVVFAGLALMVLTGLLPAQQGPQTVAEATGYKATSRHADVMAFIREIQRLSPFVRVEILCTSPEGRDVPLLVVGKPAALSPFGLKTDKRIVVYIQANIHAGEPELSGLVRNVLTRWDPALVVDCHTTDGAFHEETVTWS